MDRNDFIRIFGNDVELVDKVLDNPNFVLPRGKSSKWLRSFMGAFVSKNPKQLQILGHIRKALGMKPTEDIKWSDFTKLNLRQISDYFNAHLAPNSAATYIHVLMSVLNQYSEEGIIPTKSINQAMQAKSVPSQHIALTIEELEEFDAYLPKDEKELNVKALFMRACYTGARCSDAVCFSPDNIIHTEDGDLLTYVSKKTSTEVVLPVHKKLGKYLFPIQSYAAIIQIRVLRRICKEIGMTDMVSLFVGGKRVSKPRYELVSMHTARRTFCTVLAEMGVSVEEIRAMAGHSSSTMTDRYIVMSGRRVSTDALRFFKGKGTRKAKIVEMKKVM